MISLSLFFFTATHAPQDPSTTIGVDSGGSPGTPPIIKMEGKTPFCPPIIRGEVFFILFDFCKKNMKERRNREKETKIQRRVRK